MKLNFLIMKISSGENKPLHGFLINNEEGPLTLPTTHTHTRLTFHEMLFCEAMTCYLLVPAQNPISSLGLFCLSFPKWRGQVHGP